MDWKNRLGMITNKVKAQLHTRKIDDLENVRKLIYEFDYDGNGVLDKVEFGKFLSKAGIYLTTQELTAVYSVYDKNGDGFIDYNEFIQMIRTEMSDKRLAVVKYAFSYLDAQGTKKVRLETLQKQYHPEDHPRVRTREKTSVQAMEEFVSAITKKSSDGVNISEDEFLDYYADVNATLPSEKEEYFTDLVLKTWGITTSDSYVSPERIADLEIILYEKIRQKTLTVEDEGKTVKKAFKYFDLNDKGVIDLEQFTKALDKFGCVFNKHEIHALFKKYDIDNSGKLCYDEFCNLFAHLGSGNNPNVNPVFELSRSAPQDVITQTRNDCRKKGIYGFRTLAQVLRNLDKANKGGISRSDFLWAAKEAGTTLNKHDLDKIYKFFDKNVENFVKYNDFITLVRGVLSKAREDLIHNTWGRIDWEKHGSFKFDILKKYYDPNGQPDVKIGKTKPDHAYKEFLAQWTVRKDGTITHEDFFDFYWDVSAAIESDDAFETFFKNCWRIPEPPKKEEKKDEKKDEKKVEKVAEHAVTGFNNSKVRFANI